MGAGDGLPFSWTQSYVAPRPRGYYYRFNDLWIHNINAPSSPIAWKSTSGSSATRYMFDHLEVIVMPYASRTAATMWQGRSLIIRTSPRIGFNVGYNQFRNYTGSGQIVGRVSSVHPQFSTRTAMPAIPGHAVGLDRFAWTGSATAKFYGVTSGNYSTSVITIKGSNFLSMTNVVIREVNNFNPTAATDANDAWSHGVNFYNDDGTARTGTQLHSYGPYQTYIAGRWTDFTNNEDRDFMFVRFHGRTHLADYNGSATTLYVRGSTSATTQWLPFSDGDEIELIPPTS